MEKVTAGARNAAAGARNVAAGARNVAAGAPAGRRRASAFDLAVGHRGPTLRRAVAALLVAAALPALAAAPPNSDEAEKTDSVELLKTDSRTPYVHRLTLYDHAGKAIDPTDKNAVPYSPLMTCAKCHPYARIAHGWHFDARDPNVPPGRPGEPWFLVDAKTGTVLPVAGRGWPGTHKPQDVGLTDWQLVLKFGTHTPGGGYGAPSDEQLARSPQAARWKISGRLEIDCMFCHSADQQHDPAEAARQIEAQNFKWAPTAALGLAVIRGEAKKLSDDWDPEAPPNPDYPDLTPPRVVWDKKRFDADNRVFFNITRRPPTERCYFCHSFREVGPSATDDLVASRDVHLAAGLLCVDCHRNELDHMITRGYEDEAALRGKPELAAFTCEGCHLGTGREYLEKEDRETTGRDEAEENDSLLVLGGRYAAPRPQHRGLPPLHFERLTCTACHSGPWPELEPKQFQTAMAHRLGLPTRDRKDADPPQILGPIFARDGKRKIAPHKMVWVKGKSEQTTPCLWPLAHDVRPATQALGVRGCTDCHAALAPIDFGRTVLPTSGRGEPGAAGTMVALRGDDATLRITWALGFRVRDAFKWFGFACAALIAIVLLRFVADVSTCGAETPVSPQKLAALTRSEHLFHWLAIIGLLIQIVSAFGSKLAGVQTEGWRLLIHMSGAPLFILGLTGTTLQWAGRCRQIRAGALQLALNTPQRLIFWVYIAAGWAVMMTMLVAMLPLAGYKGQVLLKELHEDAAWVLVGALVVHTIVSWIARRARRKAA